MREKDRDKDFQVVHTLIDAGADVNVAEPEDGLTALIMAANDSDQDKILLELINAGADVNAVKKDADRTAFMWALQFNRKITPERVQILIDSGTDVNSTNQWGQTALSIGREYKRSAAIIDILLNAGSNE